ncbi:regulatory LuxR family protein [Streptomyces sp. Ag109_O5-1]|uniref:LuxR C-terminal-related transcriptional regulator n=1 Tax=Streptomyces sp. Ag109_O5-1 TaxID=1938851 RepID=UPI000FA57A90|nr:LuxR C-terminal-related transcriptional regulator [Streptomyces sp. Ag109_O5-1]RPE41120.1 regulatory LuxR family protein [Streptomyces sp. Ag109_O5-1]
MGGSAPRGSCRLPVETTSFVDRREEQAAGRELLAKARLVTLTGPGGVGKTRLAAHIASRVERAFPDGVRYVALAGLRDPELVPLAAADALGLHDHSDRPPLDALVQRLRDRRLLLVVDNCEHLLAACAGLAAALLRGTTGVRVLATSRHRLGLTEEHLMEVRPLPVPDPDGDLSAAESHPALALFADRAAAVLPGFRLTPANRAAVARLCRRLDGLPLAIELAAVRMRVLGLDQLLARLDDRYRLLTAGSPAALPRHQTLRAAVDWSHELCTEQEQSAWAHLSVLPGSFDLETAETVCRAPACAENGCSDPVPAEGVCRGPVSAEGVCRGPVSAEGVCRGPASVEGGRSGSVSAEVAHRGPVPAEGVCRGPVSAEDGCSGSVSAEDGCSGSVSAEVMCRRLASTPAVCQGPAPVEAVCQGPAPVEAVWQGPAPAQVGCHGPGSLDVLEAVAGLVDKSVLVREDDPDGGGARYRLLDTLRHYGLERLRERPGAEVAVRRRHRDRTQRYAAACEAAWFGPGQREIVARLRADRDNLRAALDFSLTTPGEALAALRLAGTLWFHWHACGAPREGRHWLDRALDANPEPTPERARALWVSALLAGSPEDLTRGLRRAREARALAERLGDPAEAAHADYVIGVVQLFADDLTAAHAHYETTVARGPVPGQHLSLHGLDMVELACAHAFLGRPDRATAVCEQALRLCEAHGEDWVRSYVLRILALAHAVRADWPRAEPCARQALRRKLDVHDVIGIGLTLDLLARIADGLGAAERTAVLLGGADRVWSDIDRDRWGSTALNSARRACETSARAALGPGGYERAYGRGAAFGLAEIVAYALDEELQGPERQPELRMSPVRLTRRETEVAELVAEGLGNQQIADRLVIARRTAEGHVERILGKLGFSNRSQIAAWVTARR